MNVTRLRVLIQGHRRAFVAALCLFVFAGLWARYLHARYTLKNEARQSCWQEAQRAAHRLGEKLNQLEAANYALAKALEQDPLDEAGIAARLHAIHTQYPWLFSAGVAFLPHRFRPELERYATLLVRGPDGLSQQPIDYDYTLPDPANDWFRLPLSQGPTWQEPHYGRASKTFLANFTTPLFRKDPRDGQRHQAGVVITSLSLADYRELMTELDLGRTGYGYLFSRKGTLVFHPEEAYVAGKATVFDLADDCGSPELARAARLAMAGKPASLVYRDAITHEQSWVFFQPIDQTGWTIAAVFFARELEHSPLQRFHAEVVMALPLFVLALYLALDLDPKRAPRRRYWLISLRLSAVLALALVLLVARALPSRGSVDSTDTVLLEPAEIQRFLEQWSHGLHLERQPRPLPTGLFLQEISFTDASDTTIIGQLWQKCPRSGPTPPEPGWVFSGVTSEYREQLFHLDQDDHRLVVWSFRIELHQDFNYRLYPFDTRQITLLLRHSPVPDDVVLVPDLRGYDLISPTSLPGIARSIAVPGWKRERATFQLRAQPAANTPDIARTRAPAPPELCFTLSLRRDFSNELVIYFVPIVVMTVMLFGLLVSTTHEDHVNRLLSFNFSGVLGTASSLFFVATLAHAEVRRGLMAPQLFYLEHYFIAIYMAILFVCANAYLVARGVSWAFIRFEDNLNPKILFWPLLLSALLTSSLVTFWSGQ